MSKSNEKNLDDSRKDFRAASSRAFSVGDSAEVYAVIIMNEEDIDLDNKIIEIYRKLPPERKQQLIDFVDFLVWREEKRKANLDLGKQNDN